MPRIQHTGRNLDPVSLTVLVAPLGERSTVSLRLRALDLLARLGKEMPLVIGFKYHGLYILKSYEITHRQIHYGVCLSAEATLNLQEYIERLEQDYERVIQKRSACNHKRYPSRWMKIDKQDELVLPVKEVSHEPDPNREAVIADSEKSGTAM